MLLCELNYAFLPFVSSGCRTDSALGNPSSHRLALHERQYLALCSSSADGGAVRMSRHDEQHCKVCMRDCKQGISLHALLAIQHPQLLPREGKPQTWLTRVV